MASDFNMGLDEDDTEELLEVLPEKLTNKKLLEVEQNTQMKKRQEKKKLQKKKKTNLQENLQ